MHDILLDEDGDLSLHPRHADNDAIVAQAIRARLLTFKGEWLLDENVGIPYVAWTQQKPPAIAPMRATIKAEVEAVAGVLRVEGFTGTFEQELALVRFSGTVVLEGGEELALEVELSNARGNTHPTVYIANTGGIVP